MQTLVASPRYRILAFIVAWLAALAAAAAGARPYAAPPPGSTTVLVEAHDNEFGPAVLRVNQGATVEWRNVGRIDHSVTADDLRWDSGLLQTNQTYRHTFQTPGVYRYFCTPHGARGGHGMAGVVIVGEAAELAAPALPPQQRSRRTLRVPADFTTIQRAVDSAHSGDLILIAPGVYHEEVIITTPSLTLRGLDRNRVILDGSFARANGVKVLGADGVVIENMTARQYTANGFFWTGVRGYRGSYLTAYNNGAYGLYAYDSVFGQFDHSYASGHPDSGFYIGQCKPCHAVITDVIAEYNALGYSGTNAGGNLAIRHSIWRYNRAGIVPNTLDVERLAPQDGATVVDNLVYSNHDLEAPAEVLQQPLFGNGIVVTGGINNVVAGNRVWDHPNFGVLVIGNIDRRFWIARGNQVRENTVWDSGRADLVLAAPAGTGNCFAGNQFRRSRPPRIEGLYGCGTSLSALGGGDPAALLVMLMQVARATIGRHDAGDWRTQPAPPPQISMPDPLSDPERGFPGPDSVSAPRTGAPNLPDATVPTAPQDAPSEAVPLALYIAQVLAYPLVAGLVAWDATRRRRLPAGRAAVWIITAVLLPFVGALLYLLRRQTRRHAASKRSDAAVP